MIAQLIDLSQPQLFVNHVINLKRKELNSWGNLTTIFPQIEATINSPGDYNSKQLAESNPE